MDTDGRVIAGQPFSFKAKTYNDLMEMLRDWRRTRFGTGAAGGAYTVDPRLTLFAGNTTGTAQRAYSVLAIDSSIGTPTGRKIDFNARPAFYAGAPASEYDAICILQEPADIAEVKRACVAGVTMCRVLFTDPAHEWCNPVAGVTGYLKSSENEGQARILWSGTSEISGDTAASIKLCAVLLIGSKPGAIAADSGYGDSGAAECDKYRTRCSDGWLISERCNDENEWEYDSDLGVRCAPAGSTSGVDSGGSGGSGGSGSGAFDDDFDDGKIDVEVVTNVCPIFSDVTLLQGPQGEPGEPGADGAPGAPGADGAPGAPGADGADGEGVPTGGATGQVLTKQSATDFDTVWSDPATWSTASNTLSGGNHTISTANGVWDSSIGLAVMLAAGTWLVTASVRGVCHPASALGAILYRLYNQTAGAVITDSERVCVTNGSTNRIDATAASAHIITIASSSTIRLEVARTTAASWTLSLIGGDSGGKTALVAVRIK